MDDFLKKDSFDILSVAILSPSILLEVREHDEIISKINNLDKLVNFIT